MAEVQAGESSAPNEGTPHEEAQREPGSDAEQREEPAPKTYTQADLDRITAKVRKNAARDTELRFRREQEARQPADKPEPDKPADTKPAEAVAPKREDFPNYEEFIEARADYRANKAVLEAFEKREAASKEKSQSEAAQARATTFRKRADEYAKGNPDFTEDVESASDVPLTRVMSDEMEESEFGPNILHHLAKNPQEAERISKLSPGAQRRELFKLEVKFEAAAKKPKDDDERTDDDSDAGDDRQDATEAEGKGDEGGERNTDGTFKPQKKRPAPDPIEPGGGRRADTSTRPSDKDDIKEWMRKREAEAKRRGGR